MKNNIDSNFAIAILALVAACVGFAFWLNNSSITSEYDPALELNKGKYLLNEASAQISSEVLLGKFEENFNNSPYAKLPTPSSSP